MANFKLENYEGSPNTFTFPINSTSFDDSNEFQSNITPIPFENKHIVISKGAINPKALSIQGYFTGTNKLDNWNELLELSSSANLKKFYFSEDRFYLVIGTTFKQTRTGGRNNFIDYVGAMITPIPFVFSDTLKTASFNGSWTGGTQTNAGSHQTFMEEVIVTLDSGGSSGDTIIIDSPNNGGITVELPIYGGGDILKIQLVTMVDTNGYKTSEYWYTTINGSQYARAISVNKSELDLTLLPNQQIDSFTISGTGNYSNIEFKWRDSWLA
ncbi:MAG TPA: hypothetical protein DCL21_01650 [Alphaproteobacteria bacterium]|nr:hypothetical protein [Alphaproteobacteria bacterium]